MILVLVCGAKESSASVSQKEVDHRNCASHPGQYHHAAEMHHATNRHFQGRVHPSVLT